MPQTYRDYRVILLALSCEHKDANRKEVGSVCASVNMKTRIGSKELTRFIWLPVYGLDYYEMRHLQDTVDDPVLYEKRRYQVPFGRLKQVYPAFDIASARDANLIYQPFLLVDGDTYHFRARGVSPLPVQGLILDRLTMRYL